MTKFKFDPRYVGLHQHRFNKNPAERVFAEEWQNHDTQVMGPSGQMLMQMLRRLCER